MPSCVLSSLSRSAGFSNVRRSQMSAGIMGTKVVYSVQHNVRIDGQKKWTIHAEERLLAKKNCRGRTISVFRLNGSGSSKPCRRCLCLLKDADVKKVIFYANGNWFASSPDELLMGSY